MSGPAEEKWRRITKMGVDDIEEKRRRSCLVHKERWRRVSADTYIQDMAMDDPHTQARR